MRNLVIAICVSALSVFVGVQSAVAQVVPFKSVGTGNEYNPATAVFGGSGKTSHMGKTTNLGLAVPSPTANPLVLDWFGAAEFEAANGDKLFVSGGGQVFLEPLGGGFFTASWLGEFNVTGGTGRFKNAGPGTGPLDVIATNDPFELDALGQPIPGDIWTYDYEINGNIDLGKKGKK